MATAFAGLIGAGVFHGMDGLASLAGWRYVSQFKGYHHYTDFGSRWLFILQGALTFVVAVGGVFLLPDDPSVTKWLTPEERAIAVHRIHEDTVGETGEATSFSGLKDALKDRRVWLFIFIQHMHLAANGFKNFVRYPHWHHFLHW